MPTIKRSILKKLVKECLYEVIRDEDFLKECFIEVLSEGIKSSPKRRNPSIKDLVNEKPSSTPPQKPRGNRNFNDAVSRHSQTLAGGDPVLQNVFADTARTTLQEQNANGHAKPPVPTSAQAPVQGNGLASPDKADQVASQCQPEELFMGADKWAQIAFAGDNNN